MKIRGLSRCPAPAETNLYRETRRRGNEVPTNPGYFVDARALGAALTNRLFSLKTLATFLRTKHQKLGSDVLLGRVTPEMAEYAVRDTQVTWECFNELRNRYARHGLTRTAIHEVHSVASIGKGYLKEMGVRPWRVMQPDFDPYLIGKIMSSYYGGRSEVRLRRMISRVIYCDFLSMYPTVCALMGIWDYLTATGVTPRAATDSARNFLAEVSLGDLQRQATWREFITIVRVHPDADIFPVRAKYGLGDEAHYTIGLNFLTSKTPPWYTLADCMVAKLLTGKTPEVLEAITFTPARKQSGLKPVLLAGNPDYFIDPASVDFFRRTIDLRIGIKQQMRRRTGAAWRTLDAEQEFLKILTNSTAYGISVQLDPDELKKREPLRVYGLRDEWHRFETVRYERPGPYFHPLLGTMTTGAARLMLAITERLILDGGLHWAFCDTDSMAIAKPDSVGDAEFIERVENIRQWFTPLNPYSSGGPLLKIEDANYRLARGKTTKDLEPLFCYAISAKRYALFNLDRHSRPIIRKASGHGLGHLRPPNDVEEPSKE